jgi:DNA-binding response OmpR family regulator
MKRRVLIVEDDESLRGIIRDLLQIEAYEVSEVGDGAGFTPLQRAFFNQCSVKGRKRSAPVRP